MSSPDMLLDVLRAELRAAGITYKMLAERIAMSESSIKRMFGQKDMTLSRLAQICQAAGIALEDLLRRAADARPQADTLTLVQENALVNHPRLLLVAICCLGNWSMEQIVETYRLTEAECIGLLVELDRLAIVDQDRRHRASAGRGDRVHHLHCLDDQQRVASLDLATDRDERRSARLGGEIGSANHRRADRIGVAGRGGGRFRRRQRCDSAWRRCGGRRMIDGRRSGMHHFTRDADAAIPVFHFDFGELRRIEQLGKLANEIDVDLHHPIILIGHVRPLP